MLDLGWEATKRLADKVDPTHGKVAGLGQASWCVETLSIKLPWTPPLSFGF